MKLSEKIAELRRRAGYSQEELSELLGVSRQSVSKWESGASMPEVDKLIALGGIFHVSLNELLGVDSSDEEATVDPGAGGPSPELSEEQMNRLGALMTDYLRRQEETARGRSRKRRTWIIILAVVGGFWLLRAVDKVDQMRRDLSNLQYQVNSVNSGVQSQLGNLTNQIEDILKKQNSLVADSSVELVETDLRNNRIDLLLRAAPKTFAEGMSAEFYLEGSDFEPITVPGELKNGNYFESRVSIPFSDLYSCSVRFTAGGETKTQLLDLPVQNIKEMMKPEIWAVFKGTASGPRTSFSADESDRTGVKMDGAIELQWSVKQLTDTPNVPVKADVVILSGGKTLETIPFPLGDGTEFMGGSGQLELPFQKTIPCSPGSDAEVRLTLEDSYGIRYDCAIQRYSVDDKGGFDHDPSTFGEVKVTYPWEA